MSIKVAVRSHTKTTAFTDKKMEMKAETLKTLPSIGRNPTEELLLDILRREQRAAEEKLRSRRSAGDMLVAAAQLASVLDALERVANGEHDRCVQCGGAVALTHLLRFPVEQTCTSCSLQQRAGWRSRAIRLSAARLPRIRVAPRCQ